MITLYLADLSALSFDILDALVFILVGYVAHVLISEIRRPSNNN